MKPRMVQSHMIDYINNLIFEEKEAPEFPAELRDSADFTLAKESISKFYADYIAERSKYIMEFSRKPFIIEKNMYLVDLLIEVSIKKAIFLQNVFIFMR